MSLVGTLARLSCLSLSCLWLNRWTSTSIDWASSIKRILQVRLDVQVVAYGESLYSEGLELGCTTKEGSGGKFSNSSWLYKLYKKGVIDCEPYDLYGRTIFPDLCSLKIPWNVQEKCWKNSLSVVSRRRRHKLKLWRCKSGISRIQRHLLSPFHHGARIWTPYIENVFSLNNWTTNAASNWWKH